MFKIFNYPIRKITIFFEKVGEYLILLSQIFRSVDSWHSYIPNTIDQMIIICSRSVPIVILTSFSSGMVTSVQAALLAPSRPEEELYDLDADPFEVDNVAEDPRYVEPLKRLRVALDEWIINSNDQGEMPEGPEIYEYWEREMSEIYDAQIKQMLKERQERKTARN